MLNKAGQQYQVVCFPRQERTGWYASIFKNQQGRYNEFRRAYLVLFSSRVRMLRKEVVHFRVHSVLANF
jgi:hypothetical protein